MTQKLSLSEKAGKNLKKLIKLSEFKTQEKFAEKGMCVDPTTVRRWIAHGIRDVNTIEEIAEVLNVSFEALLKWGAFFY